MADNYGKPTPGKPQDDKLIPQHKRLAMGQKPDTGGAHVDKGKPSKW